MEGGAVVLMAGPLGGASAQREGVHGGAWASP